MKSIVYCNILFFFCPPQAHLFYLTPICLRNKSRHKRARIAPLVSPSRVSSALPFPSRHTTRRCSSHRDVKTPHVDAHRCTLVRDPVGTSSLSLHSSLALLLSSLLHPRAKKTNETPHARNASLREGGMLRILTTLNSQHNARGEEKVKRETKRKRVQGARACRHGRRVLLLAAAARALRGRGGS